jgi:hypothetical protein
MRARSARASDGRHSDNETLPKREGHVLENFEVRAILRVLDLRDHLLAEAGSARDLELGQPGVVSGPAELNLNRQTRGRAHPENALAVMGTHRPRGDSALKKTRRKPCCQCSNGLPLELRRVRSGRTAPPTVWEPDIQRLPGLRHNRRVTQHVPTPDTSVKAGTRVRANNPEVVGYSRERAAMR